MSTIPTSAPIVSNVPTPKPSIRCIPRSKSATEEGDSNGSGSSNGKGGRIKKQKGNGSKSGGSGKGSGNGKGGGGKGKNETSKGKERATDGIGATDISSADDEDMTLQASRGVGNRLPYCDEVVTKIAKKQITNDQSSKTPSSSKKLTKQSSSKQSSSKGNGSKGSGMNDSNNSVDVKSKKNKKEYDESRKHGKVHKVIRSVGHEQPLIMDTKHSSTKGSTKETKSRGSHFHYEKKERCDSRKKAKIHQGKRTRQSPDANLSLEMQSRTVSHEKTEFQYNKKTKSKVGGHGKLRAKNEGRNHAKNGIIFPPTASPPSTSPGSADDGIAIKQKHVYERGNDRPNQKIVSKGHKHEKNRGNDRSDTEDNMATSLLQSEGRGRDRSNIMN